MSTTLTPRVWLAAGIGAEAPHDHLVAVHDDQGRTWFAEDDGCFHTGDNRRHASWAELHARTDLIEVTKPAELQRSRHTDHDLEDVATAASGLKADGPSYQPPMYPCSLCGTPCTGVMCLSCATTRALGTPFSKASTP
jgi:hypothetical protein